MKMYLISLFSVFSIALAGCGPSQAKTTDVPNLPPTKPNKTETPSTPLPALPTRRNPEDDMPKDPPLSIPKSPGLPVLIEKAVADLAQRLSIPSSQIKIVKNKETSWPDASLGCPQPGMVYAQITTPGYIVVLEYAGDEFEYHVSIHGNVLYCGNPTPPVTGTP